MLPHALFLLLASTTPITTAIDDLAQQLEQERPQGRHVVVAVVDFTALPGQAASLGAYVSDLLSARLARGTAFQVLDRQRAPASLGSGGSRGRTDGGSVSGATGVTHVVTGRIAALSNSIDIEARLVSAGSGIVVASATASLLRDKDVEFLLRGATDPAPSRASGTPPPSKPAPAPARDAQPKFLFSGQLLYQTSSRQGPVWTYSTPRIEVALESVEFRPGDSTIVHLLIFNSFSARDPIHYWLFDPENNTSLRDDRGRTYALRPTSTSGITRLDEKARKRLDLVFEAVSPDASVLHFTGALKIGRCRERRPWPDRLGTNRAADECASEQVLPLEALDLDLQDSRPR